MTQATKDQKPLTAIINTNDNPVLWYCYPPTPWYTNTPTPWYTNTPTPWYTNTRATYFHSIWGWQACLSSSSCKLPSKQPKNLGPELVGAIFYLQQPHYQHDSGGSDQMMTRMWKGDKRFKSPKCSDLCGLLQTAPNMWISLDRVFPPILWGNQRRRSRSGAPLPLYSFSVLSCICPGFTSLTFDFSFFCSMWKVLAPDRGFEAQKGLVCADLKRSKNLVTITNQILCLLWPCI
jgi:hypothetical protein